MKTYIFTTLLLLFFSKPIVAPSTQSEISGRVVAVSDGDTITVLKDETQYRIRFNGIDCPEKSQAFGQRAKEFTSGLVFGKTITVKLKEQDKYGRWIGDVYTQDNKWVNLLLIQAGLAWHYKQYSSDTTLAQAEIKARQTKAGLWTDPTPQPPWEYRRSN